MCAKEKKWVDLGELDVKIAFKFDRTIGRMLFENKLKKINREEYMQWLLESIRSCREIQAKT